MVVFAEANASAVVSDVVLDSVLVLESVVDVSNFSLSSGLVVKFSDSVVAVELVTSVDAAVKLAESA